MKQRLLAGTASALLLTATIGLTGCYLRTPADSTASPAPSLPSYSPPASSLSTHKTESAAGTYNGQTITMKYVVQTNLKISNANIRRFSGGFAIVESDPDPGLNLQYAYVDKTGQQLGDTWFQSAYPFDDKGRALVQQKDDHWVYINQTGEVVGAAQPPEPQMPDIDTSLFYSEGNLWGLSDENGRRLTEPVFSNPVDGFVDGADWAFVILAEGEHRHVLIDRSGQIIAVMPDDSTNAVPYVGGRVLCSYVDEKNFANTRFQLFTADGRPLHSQRFKAIGNPADGLIPIFDGGKVGLMDEQGQMVIAPSLPLDDCEQVQLCLSENLIIGSLNGKMVYLEVSRS